MTFFVDNKNPQSWTTSWFHCTMHLFPFSEWLPNSQWPQWGQETNEA